MYRAAGTNPNLPPGTVEFEMDFSNPDAISSKVLSHGPGTSCKSGNDAGMIGGFVNFDGSMDQQTGHAIADDTEKGEVKQPATQEKEKKTFVGGPFGEGSFGTPAGQKQEDITGGWGV